jgi:hypothetical protein
MTLHTPGGSPWPARIAYAAAALFTAASGITNIVYGWQKGSDLPGSLVWAGVSAGVAIIFALSWPAVIKSFEARRYSAALIAVVALLLSGAYSLTAALGSAAGGRMNAAATETATTEARKMAQTAYDTVKGELDALNTLKPANAIQTQIEATRAELAKLPTSRSVAELEALMRRACPSGAALKGQVKISCPKYDVELARAWERSRLTAKVVELSKDAERAEQRHVERRDRAQAAMDKASTELARIQPARVANSDAKALTRYLGALGLEIGPDRLNDLLVLLAVIMVEVGGGLSLAVGMALSDGRVALEGLREGFGGRASGATATMVRQALDIPGSSLPVRPSPKPRRSARVGLLELLASAKGPLRVRQEGLAEALGVTSARVRQVLKDLVSAGTIRVRTSVAGTTITLLEGGRA